MKVSVISLATILTVSSAAGLYYYKKDSADGRLLIWKVSGDVIKENLVLGVGLGKFAVNYGKAQAKYFEEGRGSEAEKSTADNVIYAYNEILRGIVEGGLILLFLVFLLFMFLFRSAKKNKEKIYISVFIPIILFGFFSYPLSIPSLLIFLVLCLSVISKKSLTLHYKYLRYPLMLFVFAVTITSILVIGHSFSTLNRYKNWNYAYRMYNYGNYNISNMMYKKLLPYLGFNGQFLLNYGKSLNISGTFSLSIAILEIVEKIEYNDVLLTTQGDNFKILGKYNDSEKYYFAASNLKPASFYPQYLLAKLFELNGENKRAVFFSK